jgi:hypothetical protein
LNDLPAIQEFLQKKKSAPDTVFKYIRAIVSFIITTGYYTDKLGDYEVWKSEISYLIHKKKVPKNSKELTPSVHTENSSEVGDVGDELITYNPPASRSERVPYQSNPPSTTQEPIRYVSVEIDSRILNDLNRYKCEIINGVFHIHM